MTSKRVRIVLQNNGVDDAPVGTLLYIGQGSTIEGDPDNLVYDADTGTLSIVNELIMYGDGAPDDGAKADLTVNPAGSNNALVFTAQDYGTAGNEISVAYIDPEAEDAELTITVGDDKSISISLATDGDGIITTIADDISAAIAADEEADALVSVDNAGGNDGSGLVTEMASAPLTGGEGTGLGTIKGGGFYIDQENSEAYLNTGTTDNPIWSVLQPVTAEAVADAAAYSAPAAGGSTTVKSNAQTDLDTAAAEIVSLKTQFNALLASLRAAGILAS